MNLSPNILCGLFFISALLALSTGIAWTIRVWHPTLEIERVCLRIRTWLYIITLFAVLLLIPAFGAAILLALLALAALWEIWHPIYKNRPLFSSVILAAFLLSALVIVTLSSAYFLLGKAKESFFFIMVLTQANDIFQYLWGKSLGKHAILPTISPSKTWEGFLGGVFTCASAAYFLAPYYMPLSQIEALGLGVFLAIGGFLGDATVSFFKRRLRLKDSGTLLPGHGGLLDRIDSLLYVLPLSAVCFFIQ